MKNITAHGLRNNFARNFLKENVSIYILSKILGHSSVSITEQAYADLSTDDIRKSYQKYSPIERIKGSRE